MFCINIYINIHLRAKGYPFLKRVALINGPGLYKVQFAKTMAKQILYLPGYQQQSPIQYLSGRSFGD